MATSPDLVIDSITAPLTVEKNATLNFSYVVKNVGTAAISSFGSIATAEIDDETPAYPDGASVNTGAMAAGATKTISANLSTTGLGLGEHTLWIAADSFNDIAESNETNNLTSVTFTVVNTKPDFTITTVFLNEPEPSVVQGDDLDFEYIVANLGGSASDAGSIFYNFDTKPDLSHRTGPIRGANLDAGGSTLISDSISTTGLSVGTHTLWIGVDATKAKSENDETNNFTSVTFTVTERPKPDQIIESITGPATIVQGGDLNFSYVLKDINSENTTNSFGSIIFGIDRQPTSSSYDYIVGAGTLPAGGSLTFNEVLHANLSVGQHTLWIKADGQNNVAEQNEGNNLKSFTFTVTAAPVNPDLSMISIDGQTSVMQGSSLSISYVIKNVGTLAAGLSNAGYMIDQDVDATHYLSAPTINALAVDATQSLNAIIDTSSLTVGLHTVWFKADVFGTLTEISESNNWGSFTFNVTAAVRPDMVVSSITPAATSVVQGAKLDFSFLLENSGVAAAGSSWAGFRIDSQPDSTHADGFGLSSGLAVGGTQTLNGSIDTSTLSVGTHTLYVMADYWNNQVAEGDETNNVRSVTFTVTASPRADLQVASVTPAVTSVVQGTKLDFSFMLENAGAAGAGSSWAGFRIDGHPDSTHADGFGLSGALAVGGTQTLGGSIDTSTLSVGTHTLYVMADYWNNQVAEGDEGNNVRSATFTVTAPVQPDLVVASVTPAATSVVQGTKLAFSFLVENTADSRPTAGSWAGFRIDSQPDSTHSDGYIAVGSLAADGTQTLSSSIDTSTLSVGTHTLYVMADYWNNQVAEGDETNNLASFTFTVTAPPRPDLVVDGITAGTSVMQGLAFDFSYVVKNNGTLSSGQNWAGFMLDQQPDSTHFVGYNQTNGLAAGASQALSNSIDTSKLSVGTHTLYVVADYWGNMVGEGNEANNWTSVTFDVTAPVQPDLAVSSITAGASVMQGVAFDFSYVVKNIAAGLPSGKSWAGFMLDHEVDATHAAGFGLVDPLAAGGSQTLGGSIDTSKLSVGTHTLYVMADYWGNMVGEGNEANNALSVTFDVTAPVQPDLVVSSITAGASVMQGVAFDFSYVVKNIAAGLPAGQSWAGFMLDQPVDPSHYIGFNQTNGLVGGASQTLGGSIDTSKLGVGTHTLYVAADYWGNMVGEGNEANNGLSVTFEVTAPVQPDLAVSSITAGASVTKGVAFDFSYVVKNIAAGLPAGQSWAGFMLDQPADQSHYIGFNQTGGLAAGASQTLTNSIDTSKLSVGTHTLYVAADYWGNMVGEGNEANNALSVTFNVTDLFS